MSEDTFRTRAHTFEIKKPPGKAGYVLKIKPEDLGDFISELSDAAYKDHGATIFLNVFENDSQFNEGTYLSSTLSPIPSEAPSDDAAPTKRNLTKKIDQSYGRKVQRNR